MVALPHFPDAAILAARGPRAVLDAEKPHAWLVEPEPTSDGRLEQVATLFVTNRECPFRCLMCDLWKHTLERGAPYASVSRQVEWALDRLPPTPHVKIYNAGSFFDDRAISTRDREAIARLMGGRRTLTVECHPRLVDRRCVEFAAAIAPVELRVAMGLETIDPDVLPSLNKHMTVEDFDSAVGLLADSGIATRAFVLLGPPGHRGAEAVRWAERSLDHAFARGVECGVVIPVRSGNGIMDQLERSGVFSRPTLPQLEAVLAGALSRWGGPGGRRVLADLWDIERLFDCSQCSTRRRDALRGMNLTQRPSPPVACRCREAA